MVIKLPRSRESTPVAVTPPSTTRALIGEESEGGSYPSLYSNPVLSIGPLFAAAAAAAARTRARRSAVSPASSSVCVTLLTCTARMPPVSRMPPASRTPPRRAR